MSGFYEGGYSAYGGGGSQNNAGSGGYNYNAGGSSDAFSGSMGSSSYNYNAGNLSDAFSGSMGTSSSTTLAMLSSHQTQPIQWPNAPSSSSSLHQNQQYQYQQPSNMGNSMSGVMNFWNPTMTMAANAMVTGKLGNVNSQVMIHDERSGIDGERVPSEGLGQRRCPDWNGACWDYNPTLPWTTPTLGGR